ncbi:MAG TPA: hypothetical protein VJ464_03225 [Blastocatellia bacterium]|nr:hypothetical protein [Blastocatellia bacterium]
MDPNTKDLLQLIAAFASIPFTVIGAIWGAERGARRAYELSERSALERDARAKAEQGKQQDEQIKSVRLLLGLEIRQNFIDLSWFRDNLKDTLGEEISAYYGQAIADAERKLDKYKWFEKRQHFTAVYLPDWSHRFWYGQQSSYFLPLALSQMEIRQINFFHSQLDRLTRIKDVLTEKARRHDRKYSHFSSDDMAEVLASSSFENAAPYLWQEFIAIIDQILSLGNPLAAVTEEADVGDTAQTADSLRSRSSSLQSEP